MAEQSKRADMESLPEALIADVVKRLTAEFDPEQIILFGSHAWGTPTKESDIDLFVILANSEDSATQRAVRAHRCLRGIDASKDVIVRTVEEMERYGAAPASLEARVLERGRLIYERSHQGADPKLARQGVA